MDNLQSLMRSIDDISKSIPEGTYLEMCNNIKEIHKSLPQIDDPPTIDNRRLTPVNVPFQVVIPGIASETDEDEYEWYDEWVQNERTIGRLTVDIKLTERSLRKLKYIGNITEKVRKDAIKEFCNGDIERVGGGEWSFENMNNATIWSSEQERRECTTKVYERSIYQNYKTRMNQCIERLRHEAIGLRFNLGLELEDIKDRQNYLRDHYNI